VNETQVSVSLQDTLIDDNQHIELKDKQLHLNQDNFENQSQCLNIFF